jgi:thiosulfate/3-mercaptopyruvate sulfurtransferase
LEVWEKVLIDAEKFQGDVHSYVPCTTCHLGQNVSGSTMETKYAAHEGMITDPSADPQASACAECHTDIAPYQQYSLHYTLAGYDTVLQARSVPENHPIIEEGQANHCNSCHATCGQCHVSQPTSVGGGLIEGHVFNGTPSMSRQCTACHGSRVKNEYTGANEGLPADVHLRQGRMVCTDCHSGGDMHGTDYVTEDGATRDHRYDGPQTPACTDCHAEVTGIGSGNEYHEAHGTEVLSCQVCHSVSYINCQECHLQKSDEGQPFYQLGHEEMAFTIGRNPRRDTYRPYRYVPLRHVPTFPELFDLYGENVLSNFDALPTWTYATPHNIQLRTPQTESCESCHGNDAVFLTPDKVPADQLQANLSVIVPAAPPIPDLYRPFVPGQETVPTVSAPAGSDPMDAQPPADPMDAQPPADPMDAAPPAAGADPMDAAPPPTADPMDAPSGS